MARSVGIDAIYVVAPPAAMNLLSDGFVGDLERRPTVKDKKTGEKRRATPAEFREKLRGLGVAYARVPDGGQNIATLAADAVLGLMQQNDLEPRDVGRLYGATETSFDNSKPFTTDVKGMIEQRKGPGSTNKWHTVEYKFACNAGGAAILDTADWILADPKRKSDRVGIVVASDFAKYDLKSAGEWTGGAGAAAVLVRQSPRMLEIDPEIRGYSSREAYDFYKPAKMEKKPPAPEANGNGAVHVVNVLSLGESDNGGLSFVSHLDTPIVNARESIVSYNDTSRDIFDEVKQKALEKRIKGKPVLEEGRSLLSIVSAIAPHIPYRGQPMVSYAEALLHDVRGGREGDEIATEMGPEPLREGFSSQRDFEDAKRKHVEKFMGTKQYRVQVAEKLAGPLTFAPFTGNTYTAAQLIATASMFASKIQDATAMSFGGHTRRPAITEMDRIVRKNRDVRNDFTGKHVLLSWYGSGAEAFGALATVANGWKEQARKIRMPPVEHELTLAEYETLHKNYDTPIPSIAAIKEPSFRLTSIDHEGRRKYKYVEGETPLEVALKKRQLTIADLKIEPRKLEPELVVR
ncbi:MAG: hydroxymethylglutaryl-CoA synthase family protein [Candidatus Aenigmarchaeota archaeon]|nr:hydroxymethylglutaryl-CoA synthase family protein [Candidatus Aenigmarchaeota archaeon]